MRNDDAKDDHHHDHSGHSHQNLSRREVLMGLGAAAVAAATPPPSLGSLLRRTPATWSQNATGASLFRIQRVTDGVYAAIARPAAMINCNAAIIVGSDQALVVDAHSKPSAARALISQIRAEVTDRPVRYVVNSHFHWDHSQGNLAYPEAFGAQTQVVSSAGTREWLEREGVKRLRDSLESIPKQIADLKKQAAASKKDADRKTLAAQSAELEAYLKEMTPPEKQIKLPTLTFERRLVLHHGGREVHLLFLGRGHTARRCRRLRPRREGRCDGRLDAQRFALHGRRLSGRLVRHSDGARGPRFRPRSGRTRVGTGRQIGATFLPQLYR